MDPQYALASKDDVWRLQNEMKNVYATQAEHADRLARVEQRQEAEGRMKSPWGTTSHSPYRGPINGPLQQGKMNVFHIGAFYANLMYARHTLQPRVRRFSKF